jgi:protein O-mannosyl-transferase
VLRPRSSKTPAHWLFYLLPSLALVLAALSHMGALWFPFVLDDAPQIVTNPSIRSWHFLLHYFTSNVWAQTGCGTNYYRPVFILWLRLHYVLFEAAPMGWHAAVLLTHVLVTGLVYLLAARVLKDKTAAGISALVFAVHPVTVESVAWISGVTDPLLAVLFVGSLLCYFRWKEQQRRRWLAGSLFLFLLALFSKETAIVLPLLVLIQEPGFGGSRIFGGFTQKLKAFKIAKFKSSNPSSVSEDLETPKRKARGANNERRGTPFRTMSAYVVTSSAYMVLRSIALHGLAPMRGNTVSLTTVLATWPTVLWFYVKKLVLPWPLSFYYNVSFVSRRQFSTLLLPILWVALTGAGLWIWSRRDRRVLTPCAWLFLPLLPALVGMSRFQPGELVHDRYLYLPLIGFAMLCGLAWKQALAIFGLRQPNPNARSVVPWIAVSALIAVLCFLTMVHTRTWSSDEAMLGHAVTIAPDNSAAATSWAGVLLEQQQPEAALGFLQHALAVDPNDARVYYSLGQMYIGYARWEQAEGYLLRATQLMPLGCTCFNLAQVQKQLGKWGKAEASFRQVLALPPYPAHTHIALASVLQRQGKLGEARDQLYAELADFPQSEAARRQLQDVERQLGGEQLGHN